MQIQNLKGQTIYCNKSETENQAIKPLILRNLFSNSELLNIKKPQDYSKLLLENINKAMVDFKEQFEKYIEAEIQEVIADSGKQARKELLLVVRSEVQSIVWKTKLIKMLDGEYLIFNEFVKKGFERKQFFGKEKILINTFQKTNNPESLASIVFDFKNIFSRTETAKYSTSPILLAKFLMNLREEFSNYSYICWERVVLDLQDEKILEFPSFNAVLRRVAGAEKSLPVAEIKFLKELKLID